MEIGTVSKKNSEKSNYIVRGSINDNGNLLLEKANKGIIDAGIVRTNNVELEEYTISYILEDGIVNNNPTTYTSEDSFVLNDVEKLGYSFIGWFNGDEQVTKIVKGSTGDITLSAKFEIIDYTITYNIEDGVINNNPVTYTVEDSFILNDVEKLGYDFIGWFNGVDQVIEVTKGTTEDIILTAKFEIIEYTITFIDYANTINNHTDLYTVNDEFDLELIDVNGYDFIGWFDGDEQVIRILKGSTGNLILTAKFEIIQYTITYEIEDGIVNNNPTTYTIEDSIVFEDLEKLGYNFIGWFNGIDKITEIAQGTTGDIILSAKFEVIDYSITYILNGGSKGNNPDFYGKESETIILDESVKNGYTFIGWFNGAAQVTKIVKGTTGNITLTAKFEMIEYTITYDLEDGIVNNNPTTYTIEDQFELEVVSKLGYDFIGWFNGSDKVIGITLGSTGDITLTAAFEVIEYTITYEVEDEIPNNNPTTYTVEDQFDLEVVSKLGYDFIGWFNGNDKLTQILKGSTGDIILNAKFEVIEYNITYDVDSNNKNTYTVEDEFILNPVDKLGYEFKGWFNGTELVTEVVKGTTGDFSLTAKFEIIQYTITYEVEDGILNNNPTTYTVEDEFDLEVVSKLGYDFIGWFNGTKQVTEIVKGTTGDFTLRAKFEVIEYTITYNVESNNPTTYTIEDEFGLNPADKLGYEFKGWFNGQTRVVGIVKGTTGDIVLEASFEIIEYVITYNVETDNPKTYTVEDEFTLNPFKESGYEFKGWFNGDNQVTEIAKGTTGNITLTAKFEIIEFSITYDVASNNPTSYTVEDEIILNPASKRGYEFIGWFDGQYQITKITKGTTGDFILTAKFEIITYNITYQVESGITNNNPTTYTIEDTFTLEKLVKTDYDFIGWFNGSTKVLKINKGTTGDLTLTAKFELHNYTITYMLDGGSNTGNNPLKYNKNTANIMLQPATKEGAQFIRWYDSYGNDVTYIDTSKRRDEVIFAEFKWNEYKVVFAKKADDGKDILLFITTVQHGQEAIYERETPTKEGYTFVGWDQDVKNVTHDLYAVYAVFVENSKMNHNYDLYIDKFILKQTIEII